ncbi:MAG: Hypoxic response protein 1 [bacterium ADurb.Bin431]|jgi:CBS domain-containing protein|nr:MAG: Hypoxic response protein 1 [bacterium ADurb.Bin431]HNY90639.1 CBS domain-containing protein [bacterium]HOC26062.1 CBS domain-containing protein [bacterium]HOH06871.1 CBS domain-containing protein [bacterium]HOY43189.1 CBS domain-containing protein [bacterium]
MMTVRQLLAGKAAGIVTISSQESAFEALQKMAQADIGALIVTEGKRVVGIFSERDYARKVSLRGKTAMACQVGELMTRRVYYAEPAQTINDVMALMTAKRIRHLPVIEKEELVGVISIGDVVKAVIADHEFTIQELEKYITGSYGVEL